MTICLEHRGSLSGAMIGEYRLDSLLGKGGMAEVYRAHDTLLKRDVALKMLHEHLSANPEYIARFRGEARRVAALSHPHIVPIYRFGEEHGLCYLVMPVLHGSLASLLSKKEPMELTKALRIGIQVASGLACAHEIGLIHRDVKPGNILLDEQGNALLADFGIARDLIPQRPTPAHTQPGMNAVIMGTPQYMAPEQFRGDSLDQRIDIYALGAVLYRLLTGVLPHDAPTPLALLSHRVTDVPDLPSTYNAQIPAVLDRALMQALAIDPGDRYPSANSFARALRNTLPRTQSRHNALPIHALATVDTAKTIEAEKQATLPAIAPHHHTHQQTMQPIVDANLHMEHDAENGLAVPTIHKSELQAVSAPISARLDSATQPMTTLIPQAYSTTLPEEPALFAPLLQARPGVIRHLHKVKSLPTKSKWATLALLMTLLLGGYFLTSHGLSQEYGASSNNTTIGVAVPLHDASSQLSAPTPTNNSQPQKTTPPPHGTNHKHHHHGQGD